MPTQHCLAQYAVSIWFYLFIFSHFLLLLCICPFAQYACMDFDTAYGSKRQRLVCVARLGFSTVYVTLCLRYSMYWFPRYNVSFRQSFCMRQGQAQGHATARDQGQGHLSNSDEEGGIARRRVPRRTSSEIASAKIAGRPLPVKVGSTTSCLLCHSRHSILSSRLESDCFAWLFHFQKAHLCCSDYILAHI